MEISEQTIVELIKGQATTAQAILDLKSSIEKSIPYLVAQDEKNADKIRSVEHKVWYFGGAGTAVGYIIEHFGAKYFGGK